MYYTKKEIQDIDNGVKKLTIRCFRKNGALPIKIGSKAYIKNGRDAKRYGQIEIISAEIKHLSKMTHQDALDGGYNCRDDYISDQIHLFNPNIDLENDLVIFYRFKVLWTDKELIKSLV